MNNEKLLVRDCWLYWPDWMAHCVNMRNKNKHTKTPKTKTIIFSWHRTKQHKNILRKAKRKTPESKYTSTFRLLVSAQSTSVSFFWLLLFFFFRFNPFTSLWILHLLSDSKFLFVSFCIFSLYLSLSLSLWLVRALYRLYMCVIECKKCRLLLCAYAVPNSLYSKAPEIEIQCLCSATFFSVCIYLVFVLCLHPQANN